MITVKRINQALSRQSGQWPRGYCFDWHYKMEFILVLKVSRAQGERPVLDVHQVHGYLSSYIKETTLCIYLSVLIILRSGLATKPYYSATCPQRPYSYSFLRDYRLISRPDNSPQKITFKLRYYLCVTVCMCVPGSTLKIRGQASVFILAFYLVWKRVSFLCCLPPCMWASPQHCPVSASFLTIEALELQMWATEPGFTWFWDSSQSCLHSSVWIQWTLSPALNFKRRKWQPESCWEAEAPRWDQEWLKPSWKNSWGLWRIKVLEFASQIHFLGSW